MKSTLKYLMLVLVIAMLSSCDKEEGVGGKALLTGKVKIVLLREIVEDTVDTYYLPEERVYIVYGDNKAYDDDMRTHFDGSYKFEYLKRGEYTVYAYSEEYENRDDYRKIKVPVIKKVTIEDKKETVEVPDIIINEYVSF